jgi:hypothetical protein
LSHIVQIETQIRDLEALRSACRRLQIAEPAYGTVRLFSGEATGHYVQLPAWRYPVVCDLESGQVRFDHYGGRWGTPAEFDRLLQSYAVEKTRLEARKQGYTVTEQPLQDGHIKLTIHIGEEA